MKRFHVHVAVADLAAGVNFYSTLFDCPPSVLKDDYAKWQLEDPRVNFAISARGARPGVNHLGIQAESGAELAELKARLDRAALASRSETGVACCYSRSDKHWVSDPAGLAWESFHSLATVPTFDEPAARSCCAPPPAGPACSADEDRS